MSQLRLFLTYKYSMQRPSQKWWGHLTEAQRQFHKVQEYGFARVNGQRTILPEQDLITRSYQSKNQKANKASKKQAL